LRRGILHRTFAVRETGQMVNRTRLDQLQTARADRSRVQPDGPQCEQVRSDGRLLHIDAQRHRRLQVAGLQHALPIARVVASQPLDPPARMVPLCDRFMLGRGDQFVALAQKTAQAGVDEARLRTRRGIALGGLDRLVDQRERLVGGRRVVPAKRERGAKQRVRLGRWRAFGEMAAQRLGTSEPAQHLEAEGLHAGAQRRLHGFEGDGTGNAAAYGSQRGRGQLQLTPKWRLLGRRNGRRSERFLWQVASMVSERGPVLFNAVPRRGASA
jgi:hypothetical protein